MNFPTMAQLNYIDLFKLLDCSLQNIIPKLISSKNYDNDYCYNNQTMIINNNQDVIMTYTRIKILAILSHYFRLSLEATETTFRN